MLTLIKNATLVNEGEIYKADVLIKNPEVICLIFRFPCFILLLDVMFIGSVHTVTANVLLLGDVAEFQVEWE